MILVCMHCSGCPTSSHCATILSNRRVCGLSGYRYQSPALFCTQGAVRIFFLKMSGCAFNDSHSVPADSLTRTCETSEECLILSLHLPGNTNSLAVTTTSPASGSFPPLQKKCRHGEDENLHLYKIRRVSLKLKDLHTSLKLRSSALHFTAFRILPNTSDEAESFR